MRSAEPETLGHIGRFLLVRAFTPLGLLLAAWGSGCEREGLRDRPHAGSILAALGALRLLVMALLAEKLHHEYYWLILAPVVAVGMGRAWTRLAARRPLAAWASAWRICCLGVCLARSTWQTPGSGENLDGRGPDPPDSWLPADDWLVAPEPLLYRPTGAAAGWSSPRAPRCGRPRSGRGGPGRSKLARWI